MISLDFIHYEKRQQPLNQPKLFQLAEADSALFSGF